jgi:uncharacterized membrane protein YfcA
VPVVLVLGGAIGVLLGLLGAGGSILAVPALLYGANQPLSQALPTSLLVVGTTAAAAAYPRARAGQVRWRLAGIVAGAGVPAAVLGTAVNHRVSDRAVLLGFAALMVLSALRMMREAPVAGGDCALPGGGTRWRSCLPKAVAVGAGVGFLTGLFGVGGGFLVVPALVLLLGFDMAAAVGTSLVVVAINSAAGFAAHVGTVSLDVPVTVAFAAAALVGAAVAARVAGRLPTARLTKAFAWLVLAVAAFVVGEVVLGG